MIDFNILYFVVLSCDLGLSDYFFLSPPAFCPPASTVQHQNSSFLDCNMVSSKKVTLSVLSQEQSEGVGARVRRSIGRPEVCWFGGCFVLF